MAFLSIAVVVAVAAARTNSTDELSTAVSGQNRHEITIATQPRFSAWHYRQWISLLQFL